MEEAVGYSGIVCDAQTPAEHPLVLKHDRYFLITDCHGDISPPGHCSLGLFEEDTRILSHYALKFRGGKPSLLAMQSPTSYMGQIDMTVTDAEFEGMRWDANARIADDNLPCMLTAHMQVHLNTTLFGEFQGIAQQVLGNLLNPGDISNHYRGQVGIYCHIKAKATLLGKAFHLTTNIQSQLTG